MYSRLWQKYLYAIGGSDYISGPYSVIFPAGAINSSFDVQIVKDDILERNESFTLGIVNSSLPNRITASNPSQATVIITNDDSEFFEIYADQY